MKIRVKIAQTDVTDNLSTNLSHICKIIDACNENDIVIFPEGALSGYDPENEDFLDILNSNDINTAINTIHQYIQKKNCSCLFGTAILVDKKWYNSSVYLSSMGTKEIYYKTNLSYYDKHHFNSGNELSTYNFSGLQIGIQMCREILFPEQWKVLKKKRASIIFHLNNALKPSDERWRHMLITRAIENQIFVCSVNNGTSSQTLPSFLISPFGEILLESSTGEAQTVEAQIDTEQVTDYYLKQERQDLVKLKY